MSAFTIGLIGLTVSLLSGILIYVVSKVLDGELSLKGLAWILVTVIADLVFVIVILTSYGNHVKHEIIDTVRAESIECYYDGNLVDINNFDLNYYYISINEDHSKAYITKPNNSN